jgi:hypothetical protein
MEAGTPVSGRKRRLAGIRLSPLRPIASVRAPGCVAPQTRQILQPGVQPWLSATKRIKVEAGERLLVQDDLLEHWVIRQQ